MPFAQSEESAVVQHQMLERAQNVVLSLSEKGYTMGQISEMIQGRVHPRTLYRWAKGEHAPQKSTNLVALEQVASSLTVK
jgi:hypothetical protein